jgi:hypothetical protein
MDKIPENRLFNFYILHVAFLKFAIFNHQNSNNGVMRWTCDAWCFVLTLPYIVLESVQMSTCCGWSVFGAVRVGYAVSFLQGG